VGTHGWTRGDVRQLPNYDRAIIEDGKFLDYALNPGNERGRHKARVFEQALGFTRANWQELTQAIAAGFEARRPFR
jgi:filamentous hemagglutinin